MSWFQSNLTSSGPLRSARSYFPSDDGTSDGSTMMTDLVMSDIQKAIEDFENKKVETFFDFFKVYCNTGLHRFTVFQVLISFLPSLFLKTIEFFIGRRAQASLTTTSSTRLLMVNGLET